MIIRLSTPRLRMFYAAMLLYQKDLIKQRNAIASGKQYLDLSTQIEESSVLIGKLRKMLGIKS